MNDHDRASKLRFKTILALTLGLWMLVIAAGMALQSALRHEERRQISSAVPGNGLAPTDGLMPGDSLVPAMAQRSAWLRTG